MQQQLRLSCRHGWCGTLTQIWRDLQGFFASQVLIFHFLSFSRINIRLKMSEFAVIYASIHNSWIIYMIQWVIQIVVSVCYHQLIVSLYHRKTAKWLHLSEVPSILFVHPTAHLNLMYILCVLEIGVCRRKMITFKVKVISSVISIYSFYGLNDI